jgi:cell wall assembly regulator SMI1
MSEREGEIRTAWRRIDRLLAESSPSLLRTLRPRASRAEVGRCYGPETRGHFSSHDGQASGAPPLVDGWSLVGIARGDHLADRYRSDWRPDWDDAWRVIATRRGGHLLVVDTERGRVVDVDVSKKRYSKTLVRPSLAAWLDDVAGAVASGRSTLRSGFVSSAPGAKAAQPQKRPELGRARATTVRAAWERIEAWLEANAPEQREGLARGATPARIAEAEKALGFALPRELAASLALHDGDRETGLVGNWNLMSARSIAREWSRMARLLAQGAFGDARARHRRIRSTWWSPRWVPFVSSGSGHFLCVDLDPAPRGQRGQVIAFFHDEGTRIVVADGVKEWLADIADGLERGRFEHDGESWDGTDGFLPVAVTGSKRRARARAAISRRGRRAVSRARSSLPSRSGAR